VCEAEALQPDQAAEAVHLLQRIAGQIQRPVRSARHGILVVVHAAPVRRDFTVNTSRGENDAFASCPRFACLCSCCASLTRESQLIARFR